MTCSNFKLKNGICQCFCIIRAFYIVHALGKLAPYLRSHASKMLESSANLDNRVRPLAVQEKGQKSILIFVFSCKRANVENDFFFEATQATKYEIASL